MEGQNHHHKVQDQTMVIIGIFHLNVSLQDVNLHSRAPEEDSGNKILPQDPRYLFH